MSESKDMDKAAKKAVKAREKLDKKQAKAAEKTAGDPVAIPVKHEPTSTATEQGAHQRTPAPTELGPTPAERSAAAAEHQVKLQKFRIVAAFLTALLALITFLWTVDPFDWFPTNGDRPTKSPVEESVVNP